MGTLYKYDPVLHNLLDYMRVRPSPYQYMSSSLLVVLIRPRSELFLSHLELAQPKKALDNRPSINMIRTVDL